MNSERCYCYINAFAALACDFFLIQPMAGGTKVLTGNTVLHSIRISFFFSLFIIFSQ